MARFQPGQSGNPSGRKKGSKNRTTTEVQQALLQLLDKHLNEISGDLKKMKPKDRTGLLIALAKHVTPPALSYEKLTEEQMEQIISYLEKKKRDEQSTTKEQN